MPFSSFIIKFGYFWKDPLFLNIPSDNFNFFWVKQFSHHNFLLGLQFWWVFLNCIFCFILFCFVLFCFVLFCSVNQVSFWVVLGGLFFIFYDSVKYFSENIFFWFWIFSKFPTYVFKGACVTPPPKKNLDILFYFIKI